MKAAFNYQKGSYWIYKDSLTGKEDSFSVTYVEAFSSETDNSVTDYIHITITEFNLSTFTDTTVWELSMAGNTIGLNWNEPRFNAITNYLPFLNYPFTKGLVLDGADNTGIVTNIFTVYNLNQITFNTVAQINDTLTFTKPTYYHYSDWFYFNDSVGIVKMSLNHPQDSINKVWELERWKIIKQ